MTSACLATAMHFRAEARPPADIPHGSVLQFQVVVPNGAGETFMIVALRATLQQAEEVAAKANACPGCAKWLVSKNYPPHVGSPMCEAPRQHCDCPQCWRAV